MSTLSELFRAEIIDDINLDVYSADLNDMCIRDDTRAYLDEDGDLRINVDIDGSDLCDYIEKRAMIEYLEDNGMR